MIGPCDCVLAKDLLRLLPKRRLPPVLETLTWALSWMIVRDKPRQGLGNVPSGRPGCSIFSLPPSVVLSLNPPPLSSRAPFSLFPSPFLNFGETRPALRLDVSQAGYLKVRGHDGNNVCTARPHTAVGGGR